MLPDKGVKCHKTFARAEGPIDCRTLVCDHGCRLWKRVALIVDRHPETGEAIDLARHDCIESIAELFYKDLLRRQLQTTATVDELRKEVRQANDAGMANALMGINREIKRQNEMLEGGATSVPVIANGGAPKLIEAKD